MPSFHQFWVVFFDLYRCLVLPTLDYCSSVWDPHTNSLVDKLESVQQLAIRLISKRWSSSVHTTNYRSLNLCPLRERRWKQKAMVCARIVKGCSMHHPSLCLHPSPPSKWETPPLISPCHPTHQDLCSSVIFFLLTRPVTRGGSRGFGRTPLVA